MLLDEVVEAAAVVVTTGVTMGASDDELEELVVGVADVEVAKELVVRGAAVLTGTGVEEVVATALVVAAAAGPNSRILLLPVSATQRFPEESNATSHGLAKELWHAASSTVHALAMLVRLSLPISSVAFMYVEKGGLNSRTLPFRLSATQRFPDGSKVIPSAIDNRLERRGKQVLQRLTSLVKLGWPMIVEAFIPVEKGVGNSSMLLDSDTHKLPEESNAR